MLAQLKQLRKLGNEKSSWMTSPIYAWELLEESEWEKKKKKLLLDEVRNRLLWYINSCRANSDNLSRFFWTCELKLSSGLGSCQVFITNYRFDVAVGSKHIINHSQLWQVSSWRGTLQCLPSHIHNSVFSTVRSPRSFRTDKVIENVNEMITRPWQDSPKGAHEIESQWSNDNNP